MKNTFELFAFCVAFKEYLRQVPFISVGKLVALRYKRGNCLLILGQPQLIEEPFRKKYSKNFQVKQTSLSSKIDTFTQASKFQELEGKRELFYIHIALVMKFGLLILFVSSFVNLGLASHHRFKRQVELSSLLSKESEKLQRLRVGFDKLFTIGGERRFLKGQDQWIAPNSVRVIWR